jgi:hypothetical protein
MAKMIAAENSPPVLCTINEISPGGARLQLFRKEVIPTAFWLKLDGGTYMYYCSVVWMAAREIGVEIGFDDRSTWWDHSQRAARKIKTETLQRA